MDECARHLLVAERQIAELRQQLQQIRQMYANAHTRAGIAERELARVRALHERDALPVTDGRNTIRGWE